MPYINQDYRVLYDEAIKVLLHDLQGRDRPIAGDVNYIITRLVTGALSPSARWSYAELNEAIGVLECAKQELYRRVGGPKEDLAVLENGDTAEYHNWMSQNFPRDYR